MPSSCQIPDPLAVVVAGPAGSGKSTLGRALAAQLRAALVDLDSVTTPLLDALPSEALGGHWLTSPHAGAIRSGRYAALRATAADVLATAGRVVVVAPFTAELARGRRVAGPARRVLPHRAGRRARRRRPRGAGLASRRSRSPPATRTGPETPSVAPAIDVLGVDAELTTTQSSHACSPHSVTGAGRPGARDLRARVRRRAVRPGRHARRLHGIRRPILASFRRALRRADAGSARQSRAARAHAREPCCSPRTAARARRSRT